MFLFFFNRSIIVLPCCVVSAVQWSQSVISIHISPPSWSFLPPHAPSHSLRSSQSIELPVHYSKFPLAICFTHGSVYMSFVWFIRFVLLLSHNLFHPHPQPPPCPQSQIWQFRCMGFIKGCSEERGTDRRRMRQGIELSKDVSLVWSRLSLNPQGALEFE